MLKLHCAHTHTHIYTVYICNLPNFLAVICCHVPSNCLLLSSLVSCAPL